MRNKKLKKLDHSVVLFLVLLLVLIYSVETFTVLSIYILSLHVLQKELCLDDEDKLGNEYKKLHQAMEMVGFLPSTKKQYVCQRTTQLKCCRPTLTHTHTHIFYKMY